MEPTIWQRIFTKRMLLCCTTGFSSGLPLYVLIQFIPAWLGDSNVDLKLFDGDTQIPVMMNMFIQLTVQQNPDRQKNNFTTNDFISGRLYQDGFI